MNIKEKLRLKNPERTVVKITEFIKESTRKFNREGAVIGISGGIDSALDAFLTVAALGKQNVLALFMPERDSHPQSEKDAKLVAEKLGIQLKKINITPIVKAAGAYSIVPSTFGIPLLIPKFLLTEFAMFIMLNPL